MAESKKSVAELFGIALSHHHDGDFAQAEQYYNRVLALDAAHYPSLHNLGVMAVLHRQHHIAHALFTKAVGVRPRDPAAHVCLAKTQLQMAEFRGAAAGFRRALELRPDMAAAKEGLEQAERQAEIAEDPDYAAVAGRPWGDEDSVWEELNGSDTLFVLFAGLGVGQGKPTFIFYNFLRKYENIDKIFLRDVSLGWFMRGIPNHTNDVPTTVALLKSRAEAYRKVVFMGCSAGGMAAILYGELVGADKILAFAPQTVLSEAKERDLNDQRWTELLQSLSDESVEQPFLDLENFSPFRSAIDIYYSAGLALDRAHAERVTGEKVRRIGWPGDSHVIALELRNSGDLARIIDGAV